MSKLTIVVHIRTNSKKRDFVKKELLKLIDVTRAQKGCLQYDLHQDNYEPNHFVFYEQWESREHWKNNVNTKHFQDYMLATERVIDMIFHEVTQIA